MLYASQQLIGMSVNTVDLEVGKVTDIQFDDQRWVARYLLIETSQRLGSRKLPISAIAVRGINWSERRIQINLTLEQLSGSPASDSEMPLSRQQEIMLCHYYGYPDYQRGLLLWGATPYPFIPSAALLSLEQPVAAAQQVWGTRSLQSANTVMDYSVQTVDLHREHMEGLLIDSTSWAIRYLVVSAEEGWSDKQVVILPTSVKKLDEKRKIVFVDLMREALLDAPPFDSAIDFSRPYEARLYRHYH